MNLSWSLSRRDALTISAAALACGAGGRTLVAGNADVKPAADDWPWWRGPEYRGCATGEMPPLEWSEEKNLRWKNRIAGRGHSTPCLWGERIFLTTADEDAQTQSLICCDRASGRFLWTKLVHTGGFPEKHKKNSHASATPASDGRRVFVVFHRHNALWATALDFDGDVVWQQEVGAYNDRYGYGSSPTIHAGTLIVAADSPAAGLLVALDRATGKAIWRTERPAKTSYGPPVVATLGGRRQIILQGNQVAGYDPRTGRQLWHSPAPAKATACTLCFDDAQVYSSGGYPERRLYCIRGDGDGALNDTHLAWKNERRSAVAYVPSPLLAGGRLFVVSDGGVANCFDAATGKEKWNQRLGGGFSASPVLIGDCVIAANEQGKCFVFKAADEYQSVAENTLDEPAFASPVVCGGRIYLRTTGHLYCIGS